MPRASTSAFTLDNSISFCLRISYALCALNLDSGKNPNPKEWARPPPRMCLRRKSRLDVALDVLDHDDGVIDDNADCQHETKQRQIVEGKAERRHEKECADQQHRNRNDGNDGGTPRLQEKNDHQNDEDDRLADGQFNRIHRLLNELRGIVDDVVFQARRKSLGHLIHCVLDRFCGRQRVRPRPLEYPERNRRVEIQIRVRASSPGRRVQPGDVLDAHQPPGTRLMTMLENSSGW